MSRFLIVMLVVLAGFAGKAQTFTTNLSARITPQDSPAVYRAKVAYSNDYNRGYWIGYATVTNGGRGMSVITNTALRNGCNRGFEVAHGRAWASRSIYNY